MAYELASVVGSDVSHHTEGHNCQLLRDSFADDDTVALPYVDFDLSTVKVLIMERMNGIPLSKGRGGRRQRRRAPRREARCDELP
jgi:predicted unusual protein kinase regulating ubiquinone biosynthesis (AarF/ABC1/UbiB family)